MGINYEHGVEYRLIAGTNNEVTVICSTRAVGDRLEKSQYYADRKEQWFDIARLYHLMKNPEPCSPDLELADAEKSKLRMLLNDFPDAIHGWFEVASHKS